MYDFNTKRAILTRTFTRYGGDFDWTVSLIVIPKAGSRMSCVYLMFQGDGDPLLKHITSDEDYISWLFFNSMDLMGMMGPDSYPHYWWNDRNSPTGRRDEFCKLFENVCKGHSWTRQDHDDLVEEQDRLRDQYEQEEKQRLELGWDRTEAELKKEQDDEEHAARIEYEEEQYRLKMGDNNPPELDDRGPLFINNPKD